MWKQIVWSFIWTVGAIQAQEAERGFELRTTLTGQGVYDRQLTDLPRNGAAWTGGARAMLYPTWKLSNHWTVTGAVQVYTRPFFVEQFLTQGYGVKTDVLQMNLSYAKFWNRGSLVVRAGQLSSSFGSFLLHYDDADNALVDMPLAYGYYYKSVSTLGLMGAQADVTLGKVDLRAQFANSSPANRRGIFDRDQYGNWSGGAGYTIRQGLRVGASAYRGPYLHREYQYFRPNESNPNFLPASGFGVDAQWARGHWNVSGEWQRFILAYKAVPTLFRGTGYAEARYTLHPRWYVAGRIGHSYNSRAKEQQAYEMALGYRLNARQLLKVGYQIQRGTDILGNHQNALMFQFVTTLRPISVAAR